MKTKTRERVASIARMAAQDEMHSTTRYHVITVRFSDGPSIDIPFLPWQPRTEVNLPGRYVVDPK